MQIIYANEIIFNDVDYSPSTNKLKDWGYYWDRIVSSLMKILLLGLYITMQPELVNIKILNYKIFSP